MEITNLENIKDYVSFIYAKHKKRNGIYNGTIYVCAPVKRLNGNINFLYPLEAQICYYTMAKSESFGRYMLIYLDDRAYSSLSIKRTCLVNNMCATIDRNNDIKLYLDNKKIFTTLEEAEDYINKIKNGDIILKETPITITLKEVSSKNEKEYTYII